ncbi:hypothetical protein [Nocardiopsis xinjiangensis]|uniref:hypothetical protein n=1 Tax=Nocardiopsis xinjiangensis TaxID=124285 RepID=UPI0009FCEF2F|nr:hypothetical protein [Nocardiopsis xinjiangensis]
MRSDTVLTREKGLRVVEGKTAVRWRNANARDPHVLAAQRRERARVRSEKGVRWGGRPLPTAA